MSFSKWSKMSVLYFCILLASGHLYRIGHKIRVNNLYLGAIENRNLADVQRQLHNGADVDMRDDKGTPAVSKAARVDGEIVKILVAHQANVNVVGPDGRSVLMLVSRLYDADVIAAVLVRGGRLNARDRNGWTALYYAVVSIKPANVRALLYAGADIGEVNDRKDTPLVLARKLMVTKGMKPNDKVNISEIVGLIKGRSASESSHK